MKKRIVFFSLALALLLAVAPTAGEASFAAAEIPSGGLVMLNTDNIIITLTKINHDREGYFTDMDFVIENNGATDKFISNATDAIKINNRTLNAGLQGTVAAGKKSNMKVRFSSLFAQGDTKLLGIGTVYDITMRFCSSDPDDYTLGSYKEYAPSSLRLTEGTYHGFSNGNLVFSSRDVDIYECGFISNFTYDEAIFVAHNKSNTDLELQFANLAVNGFMNKGREANGLLYSNTYGAYHVTLFDQEMIPKDSVKDIEFMLKSTIPSDSWWALDTIDVGIVTAKYGSSAAPAPASAPSNMVNPSPANVFVNDAKKGFEAYLIDGSNYFKLRDLAMALNGTNKQFGVDYDSATRAIALMTNQPYAPIGGEMETGDRKVKAANPTQSKIYIDGKELDFVVYMIGGNNFFKLRDLMSALDVAVTYDSKTRSVGVDTSQSYMPE